MVRAAFGIVYNSTSNAAAGVVANGSSTTVPNGSGQIVSLLKDGMPRWRPRRVAIFRSRCGPGARRRDRDATAPGSELRSSSPAVTVELEHPARNQPQSGRRGLVRGKSGCVVVGSRPFDSELAERGYFAIGTGFTDFTSASDAALLTTPISGLSAAQKDTLATRGVSLTPYANFPQNQTVKQALLQFPQYTLGSATAAGSGVTSAPLGSTWYDSFQLSVTERAYHGLVLNLNYNYSKNLDNFTEGCSAVTPCPVSDVFNRGLNKTYSAFDLPHQLRLTAQYEVPRIQSSLPVLKNRVVSYALSGWGLGTYLTYQSAAMLTRPTSSGSLPISQFLGRGPGGAQLKKNADGSLMSPWSVDWTDNCGKHHTDPLDINCHCFDPTKTVVLIPTLGERAKRAVGRQPECHPLVPWPPLSWRELELQPQLPNQRTGDDEFPGRVQ